MKCPTCSNVNLVMSERHGVEIDYCPECRGVWLDRGELDKIIERAAEQPDVRPQQVAPVYPQEQYQPRMQQNYKNDHGHHQGYGHQKPYRKKSFLEELFD